MWNRPPHGTARTCRTPGCSQTALSRARPSHPTSVGHAALARSAGYMTDAFLEVYAMIDTCLKPSPSSAERIAPMRLSIISLGHTYASFYVRCGPSRAERMQSISGCAQPNRRGEGTI